jgi:hypothetical protein
LSLLLLLRAVGFCSLEEKAEEMMKSVPLQLREQGLQVNAFVD